MIEAYFNILCRQEVDSGQEVGFMSACFVWFSSFFGQTGMHFYMVDWILVSKMQQLFTHEKHESMSEVRRVRACPSFVPYVLKSHNLEQNHKTHRMLEERPS